jgi:hypothetical protein
LTHEVSRHVRACGPRRIAYLDSRLAQLFLDHWAETVAVEVEPHRWHASQLLVERLDLFGDRPTVAMHAKRGHSNGVAQATHVVALLEETVGGDLTRR